MPYRIDIDSPPAEALDVLVRLGALDIEMVWGGLAAILPDGVARDTVAAALGGASVTVSEAVARDSGSVWLLSPRSVRIGGIAIVSADEAAPAEALRMSDAHAFGTGHHATTALCIEALEEIVPVDRPQSILDVGTGSGILALAALRMGVPEAVGLDIDGDALAVAGENARRNHLAERLRLVPGGPEAVNGKWPLIVANVLAAPLIEMAPVLVRRLGSGGRLVLSGIARSLEEEVRQAYRHFGVRNFGSRTRDGWAVVVGQAGW